MDDDDGFWLVEVMGSCSPDLNYRALDGLTTEYVEIPRKKNTRLFAGRQRQDRESNAHAKKVLLVLESSSPEVVHISRAVCVSKG